MPAPTPPRYPQHQNLHDRHDQLGMRRRNQNRATATSNASVIFCLVIFSIVSCAVDSFAPSFCGRSTATVLFSSTSLEQKTVKELRQMLQESDLNERGLQSRLKKKQDLIDFLEENTLEESEQGSDNTGEPEEEKESDNGSETEETESFTEIEAPSLQIPAELASTISISLQERMFQKGIHSLLPSQVASFQRIYSGRDVVLQAPTGSGKTLAYVLPLLSQKQVWKRKKIASPRIITIAPSRELAQQVGKEWSKFSGLPVVTVFGGVPLERHVNLLKNKPHALVCTPGRLRELVREGYVDYSQVAALVIDEADTLLDKSDSPDVQAILEEIERTVGERDEPEYQLVLVSATINQNVVEFTEELEISPNAYVRVNGSESKVLVQPSHGKTGQAKSNVPTVRHWHMSCKSSARSSIAANLISIWSPRLTIIFVPTKKETEPVASFLSNKILLGDVRILHGDMAQSARSRSIALIREAAHEGTTQVLVATDVASRGLDLPNVDLVVQFGVPKFAGRDGTYSAELYTHRTGRTGRVRSAQHRGDIEAANAIMLYDPAMGEGKVVPDLVSEIQDKLRIEILPKPIPAAAEVVEASYERTIAALGLSGNGGGELASYFKSKLEQEETLDTKDPRQLLEYLSRAMAAFSNLDSSTSPFHQHCSLLSGSNADRTLRLLRTDGTRLTPPEVTKLCKNIGSGKMGRVVICRDGSAVFDLPAKRANNLVEAMAEAPNANDWLLEIPSVLPEIQ